MTPIDHYKKAEETGDDSVRTFVERELGAYIIHEYDGEQDEPVAWTTFLAGAVCGMLAVAGASLLWLWLL